MRGEPNLRIEQYRNQNNPIGKSPHGVNYGWFTIHRVSGTLQVMSSGSGNSEWEHVSVSLRDRCPTWEEMCFVKNLFWHEEETVIQFHPKITKYVNKCKTCLHLWKKADHDHELPPDENV